MEVDMELSRKTTILLTPELHDRMTRLAARRGTSLGGLVREACMAHYGLVPREERIAAVEELGALSLPVAAPEVMERESTPNPEDLLPQRRGKGSRRAGSGRT
jgi:predicted DNA-binding protein